MRIGSLRSLQISYGAPVLVETDRSQPILIAAAEYDADALPVTVNRDQ